MSEKENRTNRLVAKAKEILSSPHLSELSLNIAIIAGLFLLSLSFLLVVIEDCLFAEQ